MQIYESVYCELYACIHTCIIEYIVQTIYVSILCLCPVQFAAHSGYRARSNVVSLRSSSHSTEPASRRMNTCGHAIYIKYIIQICAHNVLNGAPAAAELRAVRLADYTHVMSCDDKTHKSLYARARTTRAKHISVNFLRSARSVSVIAQYIFCYYDYCYDYYVAVWRIATCVREFRCFRVMCDACARFMYR